MISFSYSTLHQILKFQQRQERKNLDELTVFQSFGECVMKNKCLSTFIGSVRPCEVIQNYWSANQNNFVWQQPLCCCFYILPPLFLRKCRFKLIARGILRHLICPNLCSTHHSGRGFSSHWKLPQSHTVYNNLSLLCRRGGEQYGFWTIF